VQTCWANEQYLSLARLQPRLVELSAARTHYTALSALYDQCSPALLETRTPLHLSSFTPEVQTRGRSKPPSPTRSVISGQSSVILVADPLGYELQYCRLYDTCTATLHVKLGLLPLVLISTVLPADGHVGRNMLQDNKIRLCVLCWLQRSSTFS
jgi:hypothetical protein